MSRSTSQTNQRILRRLLTNPGDYIWNLDYGGGLALFVGATTSPTDIEGVIRTQMSLEAAVTATPAPKVLVTALDTTSGYVTADINYADSSSGNPAKLNLSINS